MPTWSTGVIDAVEKAGLAVEGVDLISSALVRAIGGQEATEQPEAIVSVGAGLTVVVIHQQGRPQFVRTVGAGGNATTAAISAALDLPINDAEAVKRRMGEDSPQMQAASRAAMSSMQDLVSEIKNSVQYFASLPGRLPVGRVLVTGGGTDLEGFVPMLEEQVGLPVLRVSPLDRVDHSKLGLSDEQASEVGPVLASPIGLALPEPDKSVKKFNLIPPEVAHRMRLKRIQERTLVACAAVLVLLLGFGAWKFYKVHNTENSVNALQGNIATLNAQVPKYDLVVAANNAYTAGPHRRNQVLSSAIDWPLAWNQLVAITPAGAQVQSFNGTTVAPATTSGSVSRPSSTTTASSAAASGTATAGSAPTSAAIGTVAIGVVGPGPDLSISEAWINAIAGSHVLRQSPARCDNQQLRLDLVPVHHLGHAQCQPRQECEPPMNSVREYRMPLIISGGALIVALLIWVAVVAPQNSKLSSLQAKQSQLSSQQTSLEAKLASLKSEKQRLSSSCADLQKIATQIPTVQSPTDVDAEESSFESQFNALTASTGVTLTQFSGFSPASATGTTPTAPTTPATGRSRRHRM